MPTAGPRRQGFVRTGPADARLPSTRVRRSSTGCATCEVSTATARLSFINLLPFEEPGAEAIAERFTARTAASASAPELPHWLTWTWGGHAELAASGFVWGAFLGPCLAAVACGYLVGRRHLDVAVATDPAFRRLDLALACVTAAADAARAAGLTPTWAASRVNLASRALATAAGFRPVRDEVVYWTGPARAH